MRFPMHFASNECARRSSRPGQTYDDHSRPAAHLMNVQQNTLACSTLLECPAVHPFGLAQSFASTVQYLCAVCESCNQNRSCTIIYMLDGMWVCDTYRSVSVFAFATDQKARFAWLEQAEKGVAGDATHIMGEPGCEFFQICIRGDSQ